MVADVTVDGREETVTLIRRAGGEAVFMQTDVSRPRDVAALTID